MDSPFLHEGREGEGRGCRPGGRGGGGEGCACGPGGRGDRGRVEEDGGGGEEGEGRQRAVEEDRENHTEKITGQGGTSKLTHWVSTV